MKNNRKLDNSSSIEREIVNIVKMLEARDSDFVDIARQRPDRMASSVAVICAYNREDYEKMKANRGRSATERFVFYSDVYNPDRVGSVAIYGKKVVEHYCFLRAGMTMFGRKVKNVRVLMGARPFVDVTFAA